MTDEQIIHRLATEVMGWEKMNYPYKASNGKECFGAWWGIASLRPPKHLVSKWNPLTDWNHWRQVEEKMMEEEKLYSVFLAKIIEEWDGSFVAFDDVKKILKAVLPTRCKALLAALDSLK